MSSPTLFRQAHVVNEGSVKVQDVLVENDLILAVGIDLAQNDGDPAVKAKAEKATVKDCRGLWLMPGCIDDQVHFREPGLTHKAEIAQSPQRPQREESPPSWKCPTPCRRH